MNGNPGSYLRPSTFDPLFTFSPHVRAVAKSCTDRLKVLKALAGTSWGQDSETMVMTYKALIRSKIDYAAPIWSPNIKPSPITRLQSIQNTALRLATGCHKMASWQHLHSEVKILPVLDHAQMTSTQFLASTMRPTHPSHQTVNSPAGPRAMKRTLKSAYIGHLSPHLESDVLHPGAYPETLRAIHTSFVEASINAIGTNPVLGQPAPQVDSSELSLPRTHRTTLSQLRSGYCKSLRSYQSKIGLSPSPTCPECSTDDHTTPHLFNCETHETTLEVKDLWLQPKKTTRFLSHTPSFSYLLPPVPPPPEPPP